jgi:hypothetical protein
MHAAPSSLTLNPGQSQPVHVIVRLPENSAPGEYRAHLQVHLVHSNAGVPERTDPHGGILVKADVVLAVPVIVRTGAKTLQMGIDQPKLTHDAKGRPVVEMYLTRAGNISAMGDIAVTCTPAGGSPRQIKFFGGQAVYRPLARRFVSLPLDETPAGVALSGCQLDVAYKAQRDQGGKTLAAARISPQ